MLQLARIPPSAITAATFTHASTLLQLARIPPSAITPPGKYFIRRQLQLARIPPPAITVETIGAVLERCSWPAFPHRL